MEIDNASKTFIAWNEEKIRDDEDLRNLVNEVTDRAREWLLEHMGELREKLLEKMIKGAQEHGAPIHPLQRVERELEGEYLDLIGWSQVLKYNQQRLSEK